MKATGQLAFRASSLDGIKKLCVYMAPDSKRDDVFDARRKRDVYLRPMIINNEDSGKE